MFRLVAFRLLSLVALAVCMALLVDSLRPTPAFCGFRAGCEEVTHSAYGRPLGVPLPVAGLLAFAGFLGLTLFPSTKLGGLLGPLAILAGVIGLGLVAVQVLVLQQTCPFCLAVDAAAILLAAIELGLPQPKQETPDEAPPPPGTPRRWAWVGFAVLVMAAPVVWSLVKPTPPVPPQVESLWSAGPINVVEITDFACPYCRQTHPTLEKFLEDQGERVHFVRLVVPLEHHKNSRPAARAYLCAERQGQGAPMADALFAAEDLSPAALRQLAEQIDLDLQQYDADLADPALDEQLDETARWVKAANLGGLPQIWMQDVLLVGAQTPESLEAAFGRVRRTTDSN